MKPLLGSVVEGAGLSYRHPISGEWAHDVRNPWAEARRSFVAPAWERHPPRHGRHWGIAEIGFGRGLNTAAALARLAAGGWSGALAALGLEPGPEQLQPWPECPAELRRWAPWWGLPPGPWSLAGAAAWRGEVRAAAAPEGLPAQPAFDWLFLDLFSPGRHPQDWRPGIYAGLASCARPGAVLTSYCCARAVRDGLAQAGWGVERLRRPGMRDTLVAQMPGETGISA